MAITPSLNASSAAFAHAALVSHDARARSSRPNGQVIQFHSRVGSIPANRPRKRPAVSKHLSSSREARALRSTPRLPSEVVMRARLPVLLILVCLATALMFAQERGVLVVTVTDTGGAVIPGATVTISSGTDRRTCTSNERGVCSFVGLMPDAYQIQTELSGFRTFAADDQARRRTDAEGVG